MSCRDSLTKGSTRFPPVGNVGSRSEAEGAEQQEEEDGEERKREGRKGWRLRVWKIGEFV